MNSSIQFSYTPVLRHRQQEISSLKSLQPFVTSKVLPLIEIVKEKNNAKSKGTFQTDYTKSLKMLSIPFMVDFPMYLPLTTRTMSEVQRFLRPIQTSQQERIKRFFELKGIPNLIPIVSYNPRSSYVVGTLVNETMHLRDYFPRIAFRVFLPNSANAIADIEKVAHSGDVLILDLDDAHHRNPGFKPIYNDIITLGNKHQCSTVLIRSALDQSITNVSLEDDQIVSQADNSLLADYVSYGFSAFGDYAGVKKDHLLEGGTISPGFIFYSWHVNCYIGYSGITRSLSEFETHIAPSVRRSTYWTKYSSQHHKNCPGCSTILNILAGTDKGNHQGKWKGISISHYIYTMQEFL